MNKRKNVGLPHQQREKYKENRNNMKQSREKKQGRMGYKRNKLRWQRRNQTDRLAQIGLYFNPVDQGETWNMSDSQFENSMLLKGM